MINPSLSVATANLPAVPAPLPGLLGALVGCLDDRLELPVPVGNALVLQVLSAATGPAAQLVEGATAPLAAELSALVVTPPGSTVALARQALLGPLVAVQNQLWALAGEEPPSLLLSGSHTNPAEVRARQQPVVLLTAPTFDELQAALPRSFDGSVLVALDAGSFGRFLPDLQADNNGSRWRIFQQLLAGRAKVPKQGVPRREVVNVLIEAQADAPAGREFLTGLSVDLSTRFLVVDAGPRPTRWPADPTLPTALAERWADLLRRVFARRGDPSPLVVTVSPEASRLFNAFHTELLAPDPLWPGAVEAVVYGWPTMARRLALVLHLAGDDVGEPLLATHAQAGIALARSFGRAMLGLHEAAERELREAGQLADRQRLLAKLKQLGEVDFRTLYRALPGQSTDRWWPVLERLVAEGFVVELPGGMFSLAEHQLRRLVTV